MFKMMYSNRFKALEIPQDPTDYEEFEDVAPYNKLEDGKWKSLWMNPHPIYYLIKNRFSQGYRGKLMYRELEKMKENIKNMKKAVYDYQDEIHARRTELISLIKEQRKLCNEDNRRSTVDTILLSAIAAANNTVVTESQPPLSAFFQQVPDAMMMMSDIMSFIPIESCASELQKHLAQCTECTKNSVCYDCRYKENGRCSHYYSIKRADEELEEYEYYENEDDDKIMDLEIEYERALAIKENRLDEYQNNLADLDYEEW